MNKLYNQLKNIVDANVVRCARTTTYKHLGNLHNPLSHGNWSKGPGMYGGAAGGGLAKAVGDRLRQREGMSGAVRRTESSPAAAGLRRAQAEARTNPKTGLTPSGQRSADALRRGQAEIRERKGESMSEAARRAEASPEGQAFAREQRAIRERQREGISGYVRRAEASPAAAGLRRAQAGKSETQNFLNRGQLRGQKNETQNLLNRGQKSEVRDISGARRDAIAKQISTLSGASKVRQRISDRQAYEQRQKAPIVRREDGLPRHYAWVYGKGGARLLPMDRPRTGGRQTMEYRAPLDSRGNRIAPEDMPQPRREPYRPGKDKPEYRNMLK